MRLSTLFLFISVSFITFSQTPELQKINEQYSPGKPLFTEAVIKGIYDKDVVKRTPLTEAWAKKLLFDANSENNDRFKKLTSEMASNQKLNDLIKKNGLLSSLDEYLSGVKNPTPQKSGAPATSERTTRSGRTLN